jgi:hypothetical protein
MSDRSAYLVAKAFRTVQGGIPANPNVGPGRFMMDQFNSVRPEALPRPPRKGRLVGVLTRRPRVGKL